MNKKYVWYASYGSNICLERFLCYIDGEERTICGKTFSKKPGCTNKRHPTDSKLYKFKHNVYFANKSSSWNNQGVAFIDLDGKGFAYGRIYKITKGQLCQIRTQESLYPKWYGQPKNELGKLIDLVDGIEVYTFTQRDSSTPRNKPSENYKKIIIKGLIEIGLSEEDATKYISKCENQ